jgi:hypothetical protein
MLSFKELLYKSLTSKILKAVKKGDKKTLVNIKINIPHVNNISLLRRISELAESNPNKMNIGAV